MSAREEAIKRLENTQHNLERVQDIMAELEPRLKTLERQARRANEFGAAQADLRVLLREWYGYHWHQAQQELKKRTKRCTSRSLSSMKPAKLTSRRRTCMANTVND